MPDSTSLRSISLSIPILEDQQLDKRAKLHFHRDKPGSCLISSSHFPSCSICNTLRPSSVKSGLPRGVMLPLKNQGFQTTPFSCLSFAFSRCLSSISCLTVVALENCLERMAEVTPFQKCRDSISSCICSGGIIFGWTDKGRRSMRRIWFEGS